MHSAVLFIQMISKLKKAAQRFALKRPHPLDGLRSDRRARKDHIHLLLAEDSARKLEDFHSVWHDIKQIETLLTAIELADRVN